MTRISQSTTSTKVVDHFFGWGCAYVSGVLMDLVKVGRSASQRFLSLMKKNQMAAQLVADIQSIMFKRPLPLQSSHQHSEHEWLFLAAKPTFDDDSYLTILFN